VCKYIHLRAVNRSSMWTAGVDRVLKLPVAHGEGRYIRRRPHSVSLRGSGRRARRRLQPERIDGRHRGHSE
jgi:phosphoribosylformylglycinamidine (FGAM) synthase-like amidotransferase family enzyme